MKRDNLYIEQILDSIEKIKSFVAGISRDDFNKDQKTQSAVIMQLALIGELSKKISDETKKTISIPWKEIIGFRDRAIHDYYNVDLDVVWGTIETDLADLVEKLQTP